MISPISRGKHGHNIYLVGLYGAGKSTTVRILAGQAIPSLYPYPRYLAGRELWDSEMEGIDFMGISDEKFDGMIQGRKIKDFYSKAFNGKVVRYSCDVPSTFERDNLISISDFGYRAMRPKDSRAKTIIFDITKETSIRRQQTRPKEDREPRIKDIDRFLKEMERIIPDDVIDTNLLAPEEVASKVAYDIGIWRDENQIE